MNDQLPRLPVGDVQLSGDIDIATADHWHVRLVDAVRGTDGPGVVVDLSGVTFMDASGVALLLAAQDVATAEGKRLLLHAVPPRVMHVLDVIDLHGRFDFDERPGG